MKKITKAKLLKELNKLVVLKKAYLEDEINFEHATGLRLCNTPNHIQLCEEKETMTRLNAVVKEDKDWGHNTHSIYIKGMEVFTLSNYKGGDDGLESNQ